MKTRTVRNFVVNIFAVAIGLMICSAVVLADDPASTPEASPSAVPTESVAPAQSEAPEATPAPSAEPTPQPTKDPDSIDAESFPDKAFREYVLKTADTDNNNSLSTKEALEVRTITIRNASVKSLKGIERFKSLRNLNCSQNAIDTIDLSGNTMLEKLDISDNELIAADLSPLKRLISVNISGNRLTGLDLSANTGLYSADISSNNIILLDLSACTSLMELNCSGNNLLDIKLPASIGSLDVSNNKLFKLDVSALAGLKSLSASKNELYSIDLSANSELDFLDLSGNHLAAIDISSNTKLISSCVYISGNIREVYADENGVLYFAGSGVDISKISEASNAVIDGEKGLVVPKDPALPQKVGYTYDIGGGAAAVFECVPVLAKKIIPSVATLNIFYEKEGEQSSYPLYAAFTGGYAEVMWSVTDSSIVKVDAEGKVTPAATGQTEITVSADGYDAAVITVNVYNKTESVEIADIADLIYTGNALTPEVVVKADGKVLIKGTDYTVSYENNTETGEAKAIVKGIGNYYFTAEKKFNICYNIASLFAEAIPDEVYTGQPVTPDVMLTNGSYKLINGTDYTLTYSNNTEIGTGIITVTGIGKYSGTRIQSFNIVVPQVTNLVKSGNYKTKLVLTWDEIPGVTGYRIYKYNETTKKYAYLKQLNGSTANTYTDANLKAATKYRYRVRAFVTVGSEKKYGKYSSKYIIYTKPAKVSLTAKAGSKRAALSWKKITGAAGYRVYMSTDNETFKKIKTITKGTTVSYTKTGLSKGKTYYFKVRAYVTTGSANIYGKYSTVRKITAK